MNGHATATRMRDDQVHPNDHDTDTEVDPDDSTSAAAMSRTIRDLSGGIVVLPEDEPMYVCLECGTQIALQDEVISKAFSGRQGRAYLFHSTINTRVGTSEDRQLLTGWHTVADVQCVGCKTVLGWTYLKAWEPSQKYKEGRYTLESALLQKVNNWK